MNPIYIVRCGPPPLGSWYLDLSELQALYDPWKLTTLAGFSYTLRGSKTACHQFHRGKATDEEWSAMCEALFSEYRELLAAWKCFKGQTKTVPSRVYTLSPESASILKPLCIDLDAVRVIDPVKVNIEGWTASYLIRMSDSHRDIVRDVWRSEFNGSPENSVYLSDAEWRALVQSLHDECNALLTTWKTFKETR